ncbi:MAG: peptide chain release factor 1 [Betaproteobacteria bacterium]|jgi:peptide chain release factor 1
MKPFMHAQLERFSQRLAELDYLLSRQDIMKDMTQFMALSREHADVGVIASRWLRFQTCLQEIDASQKMIEEAQKTLKVGQHAEAQDMLEMAQEELVELQKETSQLEIELQRLLLPKDPDDARNAYLEIRAGTGGDESALFAGDLLRMYTRYCEKVGWRCELISDSPSELGGYKEVVLRVEGANVYGAMRFESGGHRVQRVPSTESQGRIHTSACTVAVMPEPDPHASIEINPADLRIDTYRASGAGGQHINKTDSAVRVTHLPTGIVAECQDDRSQHRNKAKAMQVLLARIQEKDRLERSLKEAATRKGLIGSGDRSDRIRTYNFPQGRFTDHRINLTLYKLSQIMEGNLEEVLVSLQHARENEQLEALEVGGLSA